MANSVCNDANAQRLWIEGSGIIVLALIWRRQWPGCSACLIAYDILHCMISCHQITIGQLMHAIIVMISKIDVH